MYVVVSWLIIQIVATVEAPLSLPDWIDTLVTVLLAVGFPLALLFIGGVMAAAFGAFLIYAFV